MSDGLPKIDCQFVWPPDVLSKQTRASSSKVALVINFDNLNDFGDKILRSGLAAKVSGFGWKHFLILGEASEALHDELDWKLEEIGADEAMTTWHDVKELDDFFDLLNGYAMNSEIEKVVFLVAPGTRTEGMLKAHVQGLPNFVA